tara:strand:- start:575 stop:748 length:174 start_codon:yes stop_codon:yes gene_type:complete
MRKWFHIKGKDKSIDKPNGKVITFWLTGKTKDEVWMKAIDKGITKIQWVREETPPFI